MAPFNTFVFMFLSPGLFPLFSDNKIFSGLGENNSFSPLVTEIKMTFLARQPLYPPVPNNLFIIHLWMTKISTQSSQNKQTFTDLKSWEFKELSRVSFGWNWVLRRLLSLPVFLLKHEPWIQGYQWQDQSLRAPRNDLSCYMVSVCLRLMVTRPIKKAERAQTSKTSFMSILGPVLLFVNLKGNKTSNKSLNMRWQASLQNKS